MIIFDLDGTLADCEHRRHFVDPRKHDCQCGGQSEKDEWKLAVVCPRCSLFKPDWQAFYEACDKDEGITPVIQCFNHFVDNFGSECVQIWSGRCESVREKTIDWLLRNIPFYHRDIVLKMRPIGDSTPDDELKERWLDEYLDQGMIETKWGNKTKNEIDFVFDDRPKVIRMWRRRGIFVFNCCQHDQEF